MVRLKKKNDLMILNKGNFLKLQKKKKEEKRKQQLIAKDKFCFNDK